MKGVNRGLDIERISIPTSVQTEVRMIRKLYDGVEVIDVRKWHKDKRNGNYYPGKGQGICLYPSVWQKILVELPKLIVRSSNEKVDGQSADLPSEKAGL